MMRKQWIMAALIFLALFSTYVKTLNPAFRADDSPETITSCVTLGIQHPPGYPLHTLLGRVAALLPLGSPAWRLNLMAAFFGALGCAILACLAAAWSRRMLAAAPSELIGAFGSLLLGLSPTFWSQALAAKGGIYTLHFCLMALTLLLMELWEADMAPRRLRAQSSRLRLLGSPFFLLCILCFFAGFGNHWETQALLVPAILAWLWLFMRDVPLDPQLAHGQRLGRPLLKAAVLALAGLSIYAYLPLRAALNPPMNWGAPNTWKQFQWVVLRQEYLDLEVGFLKSLRAAIFLGGPWAEVSANWAFVKGQGLRVLSHLAGTGANLGFAASLLSGLGAFMLFAKKSREGVLLGGLILSFGFVVTFYFHLKPEMIWILDVFLIPVYMAQALLAALGLGWLIQKFKLPKSNLATLALLLLMLPALLLARGPRVSQQNHYWAWDYGKNFLLSLKKDAIVFAEGDFNTMPVYYLQKVKGLRPDVAHLTTIFLSIPWGVEQLKRQHPELGVTLVPVPKPNLLVGDGDLLRGTFREILQNNAGKRPVQAALFRQIQSENLAALEAGMTAEGLSAEWNAPETPLQWRRRLNLPKAMAVRYLPKDQSRNEPSPEFALSNYATMYLELAGLLNRHGKKGKAMPLYGLAVEASTLPNRAEALTHWGIALAGQGRLAEAEGKFNDALKIKPLFEALANLAGVLNQQKRYEQSETAAREALRLQPQSGPSWNNLAISLYYRGRGAEAVRALEEAVRLNPGDATIQANLKALKGTK